MAILQKAANTEVSTEHRATRIHGEFIPADSSMHSLRYLCVLYFFLLFLGVFSSSLLTRRVTRGLLEVNQARIQMLRFGCAIRDWKLSL